MRSDRSKCTGNIMPCLCPSSELAVGLEVLDSIIVGACAGKTTGPDDTDALLVGDLLPLCENIEPPPPAKIEVVDERRAGVDMR